VVTNSSGTYLGNLKYYPYGSTRASGGSLDTDKKFTGQRLDGTGCLPVLFPTCCIDRTGAFCYRSA
jgi:hypothetical protein